jgi:hypothetical protein
VKTRSTAEAMSVLEEHRSNLIRYGRYVATEICRARGSVHSREVRQALEDMGMLASGGREFWLGSVFNASDFEWSGSYFTYSNEARNIHERTIKVWRLRRGSEGYPQPPDMPVYRLNVTA